MVVYHWYNHERFSIASGNDIQVCISTHYAHKTAQSLTCSVYNFANRSKKRMTCGSEVPSSRDFCPMPLRAPALQGKNLKTCASETAQGFPSDHQILFPGGGWCGRFPPFGLGWVDDASVVSYLESGPKVFWVGKVHEGKDERISTCFFLKGKDSFLSFWGWVEAVMKLKLSTSNWLPCVLWWVHSKLVEFPRCDFVNQAFQLRYSKIHMIYHEV